MDQGYHNHAGVQLTDFVDHFILGQQRLDVDKLPDSPIWVFPPEFWYIHSSASFTFCLQFITVSLCERSAVQFCISSIFFFLSAYLLGFLRFFSLIDWLVWSGPFEMRSVFSAAGGALVSRMHLGSFSFDTIVTLALFTWLLCKSTWLHCDDLLPQIHDFLWPNCKIAVLTRPTK